MNNQTNVVIKGAKTHNLKNLDLIIPKNLLVVFTGVSGSGKSSLVFDTIYTEAQRQLIETFSSFARVRLPKLTRPDIEEIQNISTAIIIDQKRLGSNRIKVDIDLLLDPEKTLREGAINHPDFKVEGWNWREMCGIKLFPIDKKIKDFTDQEKNDLLYAEGIPIEKVHGAGTYSKKFEGIARKLERYYIN